MCGGGKMAWKQLTENDCHEWKPNVQQSIPKKEHLDIRCDISVSQLPAGKCDPNDFRFFQYQEYFVNIWLIYS